MTNNATIPLSIIIAGVIIAGGIYIVDDGKIMKPFSAKQAEAKMLDGGYLLPHEVEMEMLQKMIELGVIDSEKMPEVTELNLLWAWGLSNKNKILEQGPMMDPRYGGVENMASIGGWTVGKAMDPVRGREGSQRPSASNGMDHYSMHNMVILSAEEQNLVDKVAKNTFRPCCKNPAYFPDCNHGMAMLGYLEILASQGANEEELTQSALKANNDWFPGYYRWDGPSREKPANKGCSV